MKNRDWQKTIEMFKNQLGAAIFIGNFEVARETGFKCCADRIALNCTLMQINSKLNLKSYDNLYRHCRLTEKFALPFTKKKITSNCRFRPSRR